MNLVETGRGNGANKPDGVFRWYEGMFTPLKERGAVSILEIGVQGGNSLRTWRDWFGQSASNILGLDIDISEFKGADVGFRLRQADQSSRESLTQAVQGDDFDIIIDDGSHVCAHQQLTLLHLFPCLRPGGLYIIEDMHTSDFDNPAAAKFNDGYAGHTTARMLENMMKGEYESHFAIPGELDYLEKHTLDTAMHTCSFHRSSYRRRWGWSVQGCIWRKPAI